MSCGHGQHLIGAADDADVGGDERLELRERRYKRRGWTHGELKP